MMKDREGDTKKERERERERDGYVNIKNTLIKNPSVLQWKKEGRKCFI